MTEHEAVEQLKRLVGVPGALRIITSEVRPELRTDPLDHKAPVRPELLEMDPKLLESPRAFVCRDVAEIRGPNRHGRYVAVSVPYTLNDGRQTFDWCEGETAPALLARLLEAMTADAGM